MASACIQVWWFIDPQLLKPIYKYLRCDSLTEQSSVLHQHLDIVRSQVACIFIEAADSSVRTPYLAKVRLAMALDPSFLNFVP